MSDSVQFAGFNLSDIDEYRADYESEDISDISVSIAHTLDLSDGTKLFLFGLFTSHVSKILNILSSI